MTTECIGFDLDGVLYDWHGVVYQHLCIFHKLNIDYKTFWTEATNIYSDNFWNGIERIVTLYGKLPPSDSLLDTLNYLARKYNIIYVTSRPEEVEKSTRHYLERWSFPEYDQVFFYKDKTIPVRKSQCSYFVEDKVDNILQLENHTNVIIKSQPWNKQLEGFIRIFSIEELKGLL